MPIFNNIRAGSSANQEISDALIKSLRFSGGAYGSDLVRQFGTATDEKKWTLSFWIKRCETTDDSYIFSASGASFIGFTGNHLRWSGFEGNNQGFIQTDIEFNDCSSWYHIVAIADTANSTGADRMQLYVNNNRLSNVAGDFSSYNEATQDHRLGNFNNGDNHRINRLNSVGIQEKDFYLSDMYFVDGHARPPSYFGEVDSNGVWQRKRYDGVFGNNGFHLFDYGRVSGVGEDASGKDNDWTATGFTTSGAGTDLLYDVPQNGTQTDGGAGGQVSANYATINPNDINESNGGVELEKGNLKFEPDSGTWGKARSTIWFDVEDSDGIYAEFEVTGSDASSWSVGIQDHSTQDYGGSGNGGGYFLGADVNNNYQSRDGVSSTHIDTNLNSAEGDIIGVFVKNGKIYFNINGNAWRSNNPTNETNPEFSGLTGLYAFAVTANAQKGVGLICNFGQRSFEYSPPSGFKTLNTKSMANASILDGSQYFDVKGWNGSATQNVTISGLQFSPDIVWIKSREDYAQFADRDKHVLVDRARGKDKYLRPSSSDGESQTPSYFESLNSDGFELKAGQDDTNNSLREYISWSWDVGDSASATNTDGTLTSTVRASQTAGVSIVRYTGDKQNRTVGHGLNAVPKMIWVKPTTNPVINPAGHWIVYHESLGPKRHLMLNLSNSIQNSDQDHFNQTSPTSSVFNLGQKNDTNGNGYSMIAYCFAEKPGYSRISEYEGNGDADGPFVFTGFRPRFLLIKGADHYSDWTVYDSKRDPFNNAERTIKVNSDVGEDDNAANSIDLLSNGFKIKTTLNDVNKNDKRMIFMAIAENPFELNGGISR